MTSCLPEPIVVGDARAEPSVQTGAPVTDEERDSQATASEGSGTTGSSTDPSTTPSTTAPSPSALPDAFPVHGLASLDEVCRALDHLVTLAGRQDDIDCRTSELKLADDGDWGLLPYGGIVVSYLPVIQGPAGWSVLTPIADTWDSGMEYNTLFQSSALETWPSERGPLLVYHLEAVHQSLGPDGDIEEPHRRTTICAREPAPVRCTPPVLARVKRRMRLAGQEVQDASLRAYAYAADLTVVEDALIVRGPSVKGRHALESADAAIFLKAGRHPLDALLDRPTRTVYW